MFNLSSEHHASALDIKARSGADNLCLFLFDGKRKEQAVSFLCRYGMSEQVYSDYTSKFWAYDPFLSAAGGSRGYPAPLMLERRQLEEGEGASLPYWRYIDNMGYRDIVAASHPFSSNMYLIGGLMEQRHLHAHSLISSESVLASLEQLVQEVANDFLQSMTGDLFRNTNDTVKECPDLYLTPREMEVVLALQTGHSNKQIAASLALSQFTVENHFKRLFRKFGVKNRTALLAKLQSVRLLP